MYRNSNGIKGIPAATTKSDFLASRSSQYDRVSAAETKKRVDDYPSKRDEYSSKGRDDYKRDAYDAKRDAKRDIIRDIPPRHSGM